MNNSEPILPDIPLAKKEDIDYISITLTVLGIFVLLFGTCGGLYRLIQSGACCCTSEEDEIP